MPIPIFLLFFIIFIAFIKLKMRQVDKSTEKQREIFWDREEKAMFVRKKSLEHLDYIHIDSKLLPLMPIEDCSDAIISIQNKVLELIQLKMVNFNGRTNTSLKLEYGTANFNTLTMYEDHYNMLLKNLYKWGKLLYEEDSIEEAIKVLEVGVNIHTDISDHYILLGKLYKIINDIERFNSLYSQINEIEFPLKNKVLNALNSL